MNDKAKIRGKVTATVFTSDGEIKREDPSLIRKLLGLPGRKMRYINHNIVTDQGDAYLADLMSQTPARQKINNANGYIPVGTGWTGVTPKTNTWVNTQTGSSKAFSATYPKLKGSWGAANDNVTLFQTIYVPGDLNATGINEAAITSNATAGGSNSTLAYAEITPSVNVTTSDTLQIDWELTVLGT
jgi:hypothetical protein